MLQLPRNRRLPPTIPAELEPTAAPLSELRDEQSEGGAPSRARGAPTSRPSEGSGPKRQYSDRLLCSVWDRCEIGRNEPRACLEREQLVAAVVAQRRGALEPGLRQDAHRVPARVATRGATAGRADQREPDPVSVS